MSKWFYCHCCYVVLWCVYVCVCELLTVLLGKADTQLRHPFTKEERPLHRRKLYSPFLWLSHTLVPIKLSGRCFGLNTHGSNFIENQHKSWATISSYSPKKQLSQSDSSAGLMRGNQISRLKYKALCHSGPAVIRSMSFLYLILLLY